jgi:hypothetical protein
MVRLDSENAASGSGYLGARRQNSGHGHGKGKKRVSDEGIHEEEGLLSGMRGRPVDDDLDNERSNVSGDMEPSDTPGWMDKMTGGILDSGVSSQAKTRDKSRTIPLQPTSEWFIPLPDTAHTVARKTKSPYPPNVVRNQKYSVATFFPMTFYEQFKFFFNFYFLVVALSQFIPALKIGQSFSLAPPASNW